MITLVFVMLETNTLEMTCVILCISYSTGWNKILPKRNISMAWIQSFSSCNLQSHCSHDRGNELVKWWDIRWSRYCVFFCTKTPGVHLRANRNALKLLIRPLHIIVMVAGTMNILFYSQWPPCSWSFCFSTRFVSLEATIIQTRYDNGTF